MGFLMGSHHGASLGLLIVLDSSGLPEAARDYKKALGVRKILSASVSHIDRSPSVLAVQQLTQQIRQRVLLAMCA